MLTHQRKSNPWVVENAPRGAGYVNVGLRPFEFSWFWPPSKLLPHGTRGRIFFSAIDDLAGMRLRYTGGAGAGAGSVHAAVHGGICRGPSQGSLYFYTLPPPRRDNRKLKTAYQSQPRAHASPPQSQKGNFELLLERSLFAQISPEHRGGERGIPSRAKARADLPPRRPRDPPRTFTEEGREFKKLGLSI
ncbi:hypothetical protein NL676_001496 [Syzygium grande]|nr:hypothetical protein NL676_001496 [Syzygium grande]